MQKYLFILILFLNLLNANSQQYLFQTLDVEDGLNHSSIESIVQDHYGYIWVATQYGLNRYDGYKFTVYTHNPIDSNSISDIGVHKLYVDRAGNLWVITFSGKLNRYDQEHDVFIRYDLDKFSPSEKGSKQISSITEDSSGNLWICSGKCSLYIYTPGKDKFIHHPFKKTNEELLSNLHVQCLYSDRDGVIWIGTDSGISSYENENFLLKGHLQIF